MTAASAAIHALWTLQGLGLLDEATHQGGAFARKIPRLRRNAVRALGATTHGADALLRRRSAWPIPIRITRLAALVKLAEFPDHAGDPDRGRKSSPTDPAVQADEWLQRSVENARAAKHKAITYKEGPNLLPNPGFEIVGADGLPEGWKRRDYDKDEPGNAKAEWKVVQGAQGARRRAMPCAASRAATRDTSLYADVPRQAEHAIPALRLGQSPRLQGQGEPERSPRPRRDRHDHRQGERLGRKSRRSSTAATEHDGEHQPAARGQGRRLSATT